MNSLTVTLPSTLSIHEAQSSSSKGSIPRCRPFHRFSGPGLLKTVYTKQRRSWIPCPFLYPLSQRHHIFPSLFLLFFTFLIRFYSRSALAFLTPYLHNQAISLFAILSSSPCFHLLYAHFFAGVLSRTTCSPMQASHYLYLIPCLSDWMILEWMKKTATEKQAEAVVCIPQLPKTPFASQ